MIIKREHSIFCESFDTKDIRFFEFDTLGVAGNYSFRCKAELTIDSFVSEFGNPENKISRKKTSIRVGYCFGKTLRELEENCIKAIEKKWNEELDHKHRIHRNDYAEVMWM